MGRGQRCVLSGFDPNSACTAELAPTAPRSSRHLGDASVGLGDASAEVGLTCAVVTADECAVA
eukprot:825721-Pyramimonas_sp.AAC.1